MSASTQPRVPRIGISLGDPGGIGPEVTVRALHALRSTAADEGASLRPIVYGQPEVWARALAVTGLADPLPPGSLVACDDALLEALPWSGPHPRGGLASLRYLARATDDLASGAVDGLCTAPLAKAAVAGHAPGFRGHTEFLQERLGSARVVMLMASERLRVALATTHVALAQVPSLLTVERLCGVARLVLGELQERFGVAQPRLAVCGLNPHAGEHGAFGDEELRVVAPAVAQLRAEGWSVEGPLPADGLFAGIFNGLAGGSAPDAVLAMYHDQGLVPFKMAAFHDGVNVTLGLPRPRTSPDHGTAFDIAGRGVADHRSMLAALRLCARLAARTQPSEQGREQGREQAREQA